MFDTNHGLELSAIQHLRHRLDSDAALWNKRGVSGVTYDEYNDFCRSLPATSYIVQWGGSHVWKVGGKVFAIGGLGKSGNPAFTFKTSELNFNVLRDQPGFKPAPYLASRGLSWIQQYDAPKNTDDKLKYYLKESHRIVSLGLTKKMQRELGLNQAQSVNKSR